MNARISKTVLSLTGAAALALSLTPLAASAGEVYNRDQTQQQRIDQGVASGQLTRREYNRDESNLNRIEAQRNRDLRRDGGNLTPGQYVQLNRELNRNSRNIYFTKHNIYTQR